jgi:chemosensory pili system protein ChpA (sensor histidine kinase/response regulator)
MESVSEKIMKSYNILIVDDEERVRKVLVDLLTLQGYATRQAENGYYALEMITQSIPDLVISDIQMPNMDGFELFAILDKKYPGIKHVLMTNYDVDQYISLIRKYNIGNILIKGAEINLTEVSYYLKAVTSSGWKNIFLVLK